MQTNANNQLQIGLDYLAIKFQETRNFQEKLIIGILPKKNQCLGI